MCFPLVVPKIYIKTYPASQQQNIWTVQKFVEYVKQMDFYNPANILVLNQDTTDSEIEMFLNVRLKKYDSGILAKYDVMSMLASLSEVSYKK